MKSGRLLHNLFLQVGLYLKDILIEMHSNKKKKNRTTISDIKKLFPRTIHAVTRNGFLIKLILFVFGLQINIITN